MPGNRRAASRNEFAHTAAIAVDRRRRLQGDIQALSFRISHRIPPGGAVPPVCSEMAWAV